MTAPRNTSRIEFRNLSMGPRLIEVEAVNDDGAFPLWFQFSRETKVSTHAVAVALSTLCGSEYAEIHFDFPVAGTLAAEIAKFTKSSVTCNGDEDYEKPSGKNITLSFSGGFDSLAAHRLLGEEATLVSIDFGGWFEREAEFFRRFDPLVVSTNIRRTPSQSKSFANNHWTFMGLGAILTAESLNSGFHVFGRILGERFARKPLSAGVRPLEMIGVRNIPITDGITELGTAKILAQTDASLVSDSIRSLAGKTDRKRLLKLILASVAADEMGLEVSLPPIPDTWNNPIDFSSSYTTALSALYLIARGKAHLIEPLFKQIPSSAYAIVEDLSLDFIMKVNTDFYDSLPRDIAGKVAKRYIELGFAPYTESDWVEAKLVRSYLNRVFYPTA